MTATPDVTVAVSTFSRASLLPRLADALARQTLPTDRFEVVIVDDGSTDDTSQVLERLVATVPFSLRVVRQANRGAAAGRNAAWRAGRAPVVAFTDDDCAPQPAWLEAGLAALHSGARVVIGGTIPDPAEAHLLAHPFARSLTMDHGRFFQTANVFYRRADLESVDGLDEAFTTGEDTDLGLRVLALGGEAAFVPEALVHHRVATTDLMGAVRGALRWSDLPLVVRRHPSIRRELRMRVFWKRAHAPALLGLVGLGIALGGHRGVGGLLWGPWLHHRIRVEPLVPGRRRRLAWLPAALVVDLAEIVAMIRGSVRHRVVVL